MNASPAAEPRILPRLLRDAVPVCCDCRRELTDGEAKVTVPNTANPCAPWWRCGDCEYRREHG